MHLSLSSGEVKTLNYSLLAKSAKMSIPIRGDKGRPDESRHAWNLVTAYTAAQAHRGTSCDEAQEAHLAQPSERSPSDILGSRYITNLIANVSTSRRASEQFLWSLQKTDQLQLTQT